MGNNKLTTNKGHPIPNDQASVTTGEKSSYTMLQDVHLIEKLAHFDRERYRNVWSMLKAQELMDILKLPMIYPSIPGLIF